MTQPKKKLSVTLPDGKIETRTTSHEYRFVIAARFDGSCKNLNSYWDGWTAMKWTTREDLAQRGKIDLERPVWRSNGLIEVKIIPVNQ